MKLLPRVRARLGRTTLGRRLKAYRQAHRDVRDWVHSGRTGSPPHLVKERVVKRYGRRHGCRILVETGTYAGDMIAATHRHFREVHSIELGGVLFERARARFAEKSNVHLYHGDSATLLPAILEGIKEPCLFWLDAHYSAADTVRGPKETPIAEELRAILDHELAWHHVILIDDAREFDGSGEYGSLEDLRGLAVQAGMSSIEVVDDIVRILRPR